MKYQHRVHSLLIVVIVSFLSCSPKLVGTWKVTKYETTAQGQQTVSQDNIGTMTFKKNGEGEKNINYTISGKNKTDNSSFGWHSTGPYIGIESPNSELSRTWVIITNKRREQKWKFTDRVSGVQVIELKK